MKKTRHRDTTTRLPVRRELFDEKENKKKKKATVLHAAGPASKYNRLHNAARVKHNKDKSDDEEFSEESNDANRCALANTRASRELTTSVRSSLPGRSAVGDDDTASPLWSELIASTNSDVFRAHILPRLNETDLRFLWLACASSRQSRASLSASIGTVPRALKVSQLCSKSTLSYALESLRAERRAEPSTTLKSRFFESFTCSGDLALLRWLLVEQFDYQVDYVKASFRATKAGKAGVLEFLFRTYSENMEKVRKDDYDRMSLDSISGVSSLANAVDNKGDTLAHVACLSENAIALVEVLKRFGTDFEVRNSARNYRSPLFSAVKSGNVELVRYLVKECDAAVNAVDDDGRIALHFAAQHNSISDIIRFLVTECGVDVNARDKYNWTPLHYATEYNRHVDIIRCLVTECGADVNAVDDDDLLPLHHAVRYNTNADIKLLLLARMLTLLLS